MTPLRVGLVGAGGITGAHVIAWAGLGADLHIHALENAHELAARCGASVAGSLEELLERVDVVDVCTPTATHAPIVEAALRAGKDVVCEKPLTRHAEEARALVKLAENLGRRIYPAHVVRYFPPYAQAKAAIDAGRLGEPAVLRFTRTGTFPRIPWFADEASSGGLIMDLMIHDLDQAVWMAGPARSVYAAGNRFDTSPPVQIANFTLTHESGAISHCRGLWGSTGTRFGYTFHLTGTGGVLRFDSQADQGFALEAAALSGAQTEDGYLPPTQFFDNPYQAEINDFAREIQGGLPARVSAGDGLHAVELATAALESMRTGRPVDTSALSPATPQEVRA